MAYEKKSIYQFKDYDNIGVNVVPIDKVVFVESRNRFYVMRNNTGLTASSTVKEAIKAENLEGDRYVRWLDESLTITVDSTGGADFTSIQSSLDELAKFNVINSERIYVECQANHTERVPVFIINHRYDGVSLTSKKKSSRFPEGVIEFDLRGSGVIEAIHSVNADFPRVEASLRFIGSDCDYTDKKACVHLDTSTFEMNGLGWDVWGPNSSAPKIATEQNALIIEDVGYYHGLLSRENSNVVLKWAIHTIETIYGVTTYSDSLNINQSIFHFPSRDTLGCIFAMGNVSFSGSATTGASITNTGRNSTFGIRVYGNVSCEEAKIRDTGTKGYDFDVKGGVLYKTKGSVYGDTNIQEDVYRDGTNGLIYTVPPI